MVENMPVRTLHVDGLTIEGYSRAAVQSYWRIPELKIGFDLGAQPWSFMGTPTWFVSHAHLDHIASLPAYVARRRMMKMEPPTIYLPPETIEYVDKILKLFTRLDRGRMPCELLPAIPGQDIELNREYVATCFPTKHTVPSVGFIIWERRRKLRQEFIGLPGEKIRDLRLSGTDVTEEKRLPLVAYLGDSAPEGLDACPALYEAKILITEMTFVASGHRKDKIHKFGHLHLDDILERRARFKNQVIIAGHFTTRIGDDRMERIVRRRVPDMLDGRLVLWT